jgi:hypothetical protein
MVIQWQVLHFQSTIIHLFNRIGESMMIIRMNQVSVIDFLYTCFTSVPAATMRTPSLSNNEHKSIYRQFLRGGEIPAVGLQKSFNHKQGRHVYLFVIDEVVDKTRRRERKKRAQILTMRPFDRRHLSLACVFNTACNWWGCHTGKNSELRERERESGTHFSHRFLPEMSTSSNFLLEKMIVTLPIGLLI